jgi:transcriptional regulator NrdR family protein
VFSTEEAARLEAAWQVSDSERHLTAFSRDKLFISVYDSCQHRKTALSDAEGLTETAIRKLAAHVKGGTVDKSDITGVVQVALNRFDRAASVYYEARHKG